jgi:hypothetical protein
MSKQDSRDGCPVKNVILSVRSRTGVSPVREEFINVDFLNSFNIVKTSDKSKF